MDTVKVSRALVFRRSKGAWVDIPFGADADHYDLLRYRFWYSAWPKRPPNQKNLDEIGFFSEDERDAFTGVRFAFRLAQEGAHFWLLKLPDIKEAAIATTKARLHRNRDVLSIRVITITELITIENAK